MREKIYKIEVGVLLPENHKEFKDYSQVYDKKHGYFDEDVVLYTSYEGAIEFAKDYVNEGIAGNYAIVTEIENNFSAKEIEEIDEDGYLDGFMASEYPESFKPENVLFSYLKTYSDISTGEEEFEEDFIEK